MSFTQSFRARVEIYQEFGWRTSRQVKRTIDERIRLDEHVYARFDGTHIIIETLGQDRVRLSPIATAHLFWLNHRIQDTFPTAFAIDLSKVPDAD